MEAFNYTVFRLVNIPIKITDFGKDLGIIKEIVRSNYFKLCSKAKVD